MNQPLSRFPELQGWKRILLAIILGAIATASLPPYHIIPLLCIGMSGFLFLIISCKSAKQAFWTGWAFGFGHFVTGVYWVANSMLVEPEKFAWMIPFTVSLLPAYLALFHAAAATLTYLFPHGGWRRVTWFACVWVLMEMLRGYLFTGFPWNLLGYSWVSLIEVIQITSVIGIHGLSFLTVLLMAMPVACIRQTAEGRKYCSPQPMILIGIIFVAIWMYGADRIENASTETMDINVHVVQGNIEQHFKWESSLRFKHLMEHINLSQEALGDSKETSYVVWSESSVPFVLEEQPDILTFIGETFDDNVTLMTGSIRVERNLGDFKVWNSFYVIDAQGDIKARYDKFKLVPFGEFVPLREYFPFIKKITHGGVDYSSGTGIKVLSPDNVSAFTPLICYEVIFPEILGSNDMMRPNWLLNVTNDAWFGNSTGPYQHLAMARVRAIEQGVPLVRSANTGMSAIIDSYGRIVSQLALNQKGVISHKLPKPLASTPYSSNGNNIAILILIVMALMAYLRPYQKVNPR